MALLQNWLEQTCRYYKKFIFRNKGIIYKQFKQYVSLQMGNCMKPVESEETPLEDDQIAIRKKYGSFKGLWFDLLEVHKISADPRVFLQKKSITHTSFAQIQKDIDRTFPLEPYFNIPENKLMFKQILQQIALAFPRLGYIQGMNFVAGQMILNGMNKQQSISSFQSIITHPKLLLIGLYQDEFPLVRLYCQLFWSVFESKSSVFAQKIKDLNIPDQLWIFQWFICLFIYSFPVIYMTKILTFIWKQKEFACVKIALAIMEIIEPILNESKTNFEDDFIECVQWLKDEKYVTRAVPLLKLIQGAAKIDNNLLKFHLSKVKISNKFSQYFISDYQTQRKLHVQLLKSLEKQRTTYYQESIKGKGISSLVRPASSVTIIDYIQQKRIERFNIKLINSLSDRIPNQSFIKFQKNYSYSGNTQNNIILTESFYQK